MTLRFLVVDDEPDIRLVVTLNLQGWGYQAQEAATAEDAEAACRTAPPDVMLLDVSMPGTDGITLLERLRAEGIAPREVVLMSAVPSDRLASRARDLGARALSKPFALAELKKLCLELAAGAAT